MPLHNSRKGNGAEEKKNKREVVFKKNEDGDKVGQREDEENTEETGRKMRDV